MPQGIREQIEQAIRDAADAGERTMLLIQLSLADMMSSVRDATEETAKAVSSLRADFGEHDKQERIWREANFRDIDPPTHIADHGFTARERIRRAEDKALMTEAKKGAASQLGKVAVDVIKVGIILAAGGYLSKLFG